MTDGTTKRGAFAGQLADTSVSELLLTLVQGGHSGVLRVTSAEHDEGTVWFDSGRLIDAQIGTTNAENAIQALLTLKDGAFEVEYTSVQRTQTISMAPAELLGRSEDLSLPSEHSGSNRPRARRAASRSWLPTAGGEGSTTPGSRVGKLPTSPPQDPTPEPRSSTSMSGSAEFQTNLVAETEENRITNAPTTKLPVATVTDSASSAPSPPDLSKTWSTRVPPIAARRGPQSDPQTKLGGTPFEAHLPPLVAKTRRDQTISQPPPTGGIPMVLPTTDSSTIRNAVLDEPSGPISVGTTWAAPAPLTVAMPPTTHSIESGEASSAQGEIQPGRRQRTAPATLFSPPFKRPSEEQSIEAGQTLTDGVILLPDDSDEDDASNDQGIERQETRQPTLSLRAVNPDGKPSAKSAPATVGRYEVLLRIARGGMGTVYLCRVTGEGGFRRLFALKVIRDHLSRNDEYVRMLLQEARIASRLHHPNVVGIIDIGMLSGQHYLVMDYVEGCTFADLLKVHTKSRPPQLIIPILLDALTGLDAAHTLSDDDGTPLNLVHSDFSPHNMLIGTNGICMISDFGISKAADALQEPGVTRGKPGYLSPEQVRGDRVDSRADIFAAGVVLWNALTGEQLFHADTPEGTLRQVLYKEIPPPSTAGLRPPSCFDAVCLKALHRNPDKRYQTAHDMLIELRRLAIDENMLAPSSDIARWVLETFGEQLELRRRAAGITKGKSPKASAARGLGADPVRPHPKAVSVPELGINEHDATATHTLLPEPEDAELSNSRTLMLGHSHRKLGRDDGERESMRDAVRRNRTIVALAAVAAAGLVLAAFLRPGWLEGGYVDEYGRYDAVPASLRSTTPDQPTETPVPAKDTNGADKASPSVAKDASVVPIDEDASDESPSLPESDDHELLEVEDDESDATLEPHEPKPSTSRTRSVRTSKPKPSPAKKPATTRPKDEKAGQPEPKDEPSTEAAPTPARRSIDHLPAVTDEPGPAPTSSPASEGRSEPSAEASPKASNDETPSKGVKKENPSPSSQSNLDDFVPL